jgi:tetratricopeptide (TPR) repeat protein
MRRLALVALSVCCAEWRLPPTFPQEAAKQPAVHEQALLGLSDSGDAAVADLTDADGAPPTLAVFVWGKPGAPSRTLLTASPEKARTVAANIRTSGNRPAPLLASAISAEWPDAFDAAAAAGFRSRAPADPAPGRQTWRIAGAADAGALPLTLRVARSPDPAALLLLDDGSGGEPVELARMPLAGTAFEPQLFIHAAVAWMLAGSTLEGQPLRRAVGLRRASLRQGEAQLHTLHGLADSRAGDVDAARREFDRALAADPEYFDALYDAAAAAALADRADEAVALLRRAAAVDPKRVQVLGRNDEDLRSIRARPDVRAILGMRRLPPEGLSPPP